MVRRIPFFLCLLSLSILLVQAEENDHKDLPGWRLTFSDEFEGDALDLKKWNPHGPWQVEMNGELQAYVRNSFFVSDGTLKIRAEERKADYDGKVRDYCSGKMTTANKFSQKYGRFEIRCKVPEGRGLWPAFWMLPEPAAWPPEIDVFEFLGHETDRVYQSLHWPKARTTDESNSVTNEMEAPGTNFTAGFHTFTVEWEKHEIRWFVDGELKYTVKENIPDQPMFLLANLAVGGGWPGAPDEDTAFPAFFEIDYIRAWEKK